MISNGTSHITLLIHYNFILRIKIFMFVNFLRHKPKKKSFVWLIYLEKEGKH
jgi:hypothetical protein